MIHDSSRIRTKRRLYLTATPYEWEAPLAEAPDARPTPETDLVPAWESPSLIARPRQPGCNGHSTFAARDQPARLLERHHLKCTPYVRCSYVERT